MDKKQAEAVAQAVLDPDRRAQEEVRRRQAVRAAQLARQRRAAWFALAGIVAGIAVSYFADTGFAQGIIWGGIVGALVGWLATRREP